MKFWLGTDNPSWLTHVPVPLMVSRNRLAYYKTPPRAATEWVMDSGGFTELQRHGHWRTTAKQHADAVAMYSEQVGPMQWASPQDWMCEPAVIHGGTFKGVHFVGTGLSVREHQRRTVGNFLELKALDVPVIPVLQGFALPDYEKCVAMYEAAGIDLRNEPVVGLGSVCRREATDEIGRVVAAMSAHGIRCHGFGCKAGAISRYGSMLESADSMAWSFGGRRNGTCPKKSRCAHCLHYALEWRTKVLNAPMGRTVQLQLAM